MNPIIIDTKLKIVYKEISLAFVFALIFILPIAFIVAKLSLKPVRQSVETMDNFINGIVHDINTPLSVIRINAQSMKNRLENSFFIEKNSRIIQGVEHIEALEEQLLFMLKIHQYTPQKTDFDIYEAIEQRQGYYKDIRQSLDIVVDGEATQVNADKYALRRMIDNIVINAIKYSPSKSIVSISIKNNILVIKDNGEGIKNPKEIFNKYYRESKTTKGLGLGLYVVKEIANMHKLNIEVSSKVGVGTIFSINLSGIKTI
jgi:signal transduction histidine kinase